MKFTSTMLVIPCFLSACYSSQIFISEPGSTEPTPAVVQVDRNEIKLEVNSSTGQVIGYAGTQFSYGDIARKAGETCIEQGRPQVDNFSATPQADGSTRFQFQCTNFTGTTSTQAVSSTPSTATTGSTSQMKLNYDKLTGYVVGSAGPGINNSNAPAIARTFCQSVNHSEAINLRLDNVTANGSMVSFRCIN